MTKYCMQVLVSVKGSDELQWRPVTPTGGPLYLFDTKEEAEKMMRMCYPDQTAFGEANVRVHPVQEGA